LSDVTVALESFAGIYYDAFGVPEHLRQTDGAVGYPFFFFLAGIVGAVHHAGERPNPLTVGAPGASSGYDGTDLAASGQGGRPGWADALDVDTVPTWWLPWLGQFVGVRVPANVSPADAIEIVRRREGWERGTPATLIATARRYLKDPTQPVTLRERQGSAYRLSMSVYRQDLAAPTYARLQFAHPRYADLAPVFPTYTDMGLGGDALNTALQEAKPAGLVLTVTNALGAATYAALTHEFATYPAFSGALPTYFDAIDHVPAP
jgi:hypothetical protein